MENWKILEIEAYKALKRLGLIIRYSYPHSTLGNPLKNNDFIIFNSLGEILKIIECKFISDPKCNSLKSKRKFCETVLGRYLSSEITYVVNDEFYSLMKEVNLVKDNFIRVKDIPKLFIKDNNRLLNNVLEDGR